MRPPARVVTCTRAITLNNSEKVLPQVHSDTAVTSDVVHVHVL